jgi:hypothetical protein
MDGLTNRNDGLTTKNSGLTRKNDDDIMVWYQWYTVLPSNMMMKHGHDESHVF